MKLHWPETDQFINDSIFTLINSKGSLYRRKGSLSPSLLGHHRNCAGQVGAGQGRRVRTVNTKSLHKACKGSSRADCSESWPLLRQGVLPFKAVALSKEAGRVGISHAGVSDQGKSGFQSIYRISSTGYHADRIGSALYAQLKHQSEAVGTDLFSMGTLYCSLSNWVCGGAAN